MNCWSSSLRRRHGLTLVELLVVIVILVMLVAVTIPLMRSIRDGGEVDAAVRKVESIMNDARTRAIVTGRPAGITFIRDPLNPNVSYQVALAESPPPYAGDVINARALLTNENVGGVLFKQVAFDLNQVRKLRPTPTGNEPTPVDESAWFVRPGDTIRFNFRGAEYPIRAVPTEYSLALDPDVPLTGLASFQIQRAPRRSLASPTELPNGAFVVLGSSGVAYDGEGFQLDRNRLFSSGDVTVSFNAAGDIQRVYRGTPRDVADINDIVSSGVAPERAEKRVIDRPLMPVRIDFAGGSLANPANASRLIIRNGRAKRKSMPIDPATDLVRGAMAVGNGILPGGGSGGRGGGNGGLSSGDQGG